MTRSRNMLIALAAALGILVLILAFTLAPRAGGPVVATALPTNSPTVAATSTGRPTAAATAPPSATARPFTSTLGYVVDLPSPYRRSDRMSFTGGPRPNGDPESLALETFTALDDASEAEAIRRSDTGVGPALVYTAHVELRSSRGLSPTAYAESRRGSLGLYVVSIVPTTVEGRPAARMTLKHSLTHPATFYELFIAEGSDRMRLVGYYAGWSAEPPPPGASDAAARMVADSFRFVR